MTLFYDQPTMDALASARRVGALLRVATDPVIRVWGGLVRDIAIGADSVEDGDPAVYSSMGLLTDLPQLSALINGAAERCDFTVSGVAITGEIAALASGSAAAIRGAAVDVGLVLFDADWQLMATTFWIWSGTADSLTIVRQGSADKPTRTIKLSAASVFSGRRRANLSFFTDIDQRRRSADDAFCDQVSKYYAGTTKVWGLN